MGPPRTYRRYRQIAEKLASRIATGEYKPGDRLPSERDLVEELKVSRPTLREALIALEIMGHVAVRGGSGIYVTSATRSPTEADLGVGIFELLEARKVIEADVASIAAKSITDEKLRQMREAIERQIKGLGKDEGTFQTADRHFHLLIAEATDNSALAYLVEELWNLRRDSHIWRLSDQRTGVPALQSRGVQDHIKICAALEKRDPKGTFEQMHLHMQNNIDWRLDAPEDFPPISDKDLRTQVRLRLEREVERA